MSKPELGTKRVCAGCAARFYDLNKPDIICPMCSAVFVIPVPAPSRSRKVFVPTPVAAVAEPNEDEPEVPETVAGDDKVDDVDDETDDGADVPLLEPDEEEV